MPEGERKLHEHRASATGWESPTRAMVVDVCVCTFRRPSVAATLESIAAQVLPEGVSVRVIVADNDTHPSAQMLVSGVLAKTGLNGVYLHAPDRNISVARNACLDAVKAALAVFIDDDEIARPGWLAALLSRQAETGADAVFGPVDAVYPKEGPSWLKAADMHATRPVFRRRQIEGGYTCNVLLNMAAVGGLRFDPAMGRSGGEDTTFFTEFALAGGKLAYASTAVIDEPVPLSRTSLAWLKKRAFRNGQTHGLMLIRKNRNRAVIGIAAAFKIAVCGLMTVAGLWSAPKWRKAVVRGSMHAGVLAAAFGKKPLELYG